MELKACLICGNTPVSYETHVEVKGCLVKVWVIECDHFDEEEPLPWVDHRLTVYGASKKEAEARWDSLTNPSSVKG